MFALQAKSFPLQTKTGAAADARSVEGTPRGLVSDPAALRTLGGAARKGDPAALEAAARAFESLLLGQMMKQMRSTSLGNGIFDSESTRLYQDLYDQQVASFLSEGEGLGIRKALLRQLAPETSTEDGPRDPGQLRVPPRNLSLRPIRPSADAATDQTDAAGTDKSAAVIGDGSGGTGSAAIGSAGQWPPSSPRDFLSYLQPYAEQAAEALGMDASVLLAQSALETGWGRHVPRRADGTSSFNLFGIKADRGWDGDRVSVGTLEYRNGVAQREQAKFRAYSSPADSFIDYVSFLRRNPRYRDALASASGEDFIRGLQRAGYATDPTYAAKVLSIRDRMRALSGSRGTQVSALPADSSQEG